MTIVTIDGQSHEDELSMMLDTMKKQFDNPSDQERLDDSFKRLDEKNSLGHQSDMQFIGDIGKIGINQEALKNLPESTNIEDRTGAPYQAQQAREAAATRLRQGVLGTDALMKVLTGLDNIANPQRAASRYEELGNTPSSPGGTRAPGRMNTFKGPYDLGEGEPESTNIEDRRGEKITWGQIAASPFMEDAILGPMIRAIQKHLSGEPNRLNEFNSTPLPGEMAKALGAEDLTPDGLMGLHPYDIERIRRGENPIGVNGLKAQRTIAPELELPPKKTEQTSETINPPSPYGETYDKFVQHLEKASEFLNPSFIPTAEQFRDAPWKEKLGFILGTSMLLASPGLKGKPPSTPPSKTQTPLEVWKEQLDVYKNLEHPAERDAFNTSVREAMESKEFNQGLTAKMEDIQASREEWSKVNPEGKGKWSPEEESLLAKHLGDGKSIKEIAGISGRTPAAIRGKAKSIDASDKKFSNEVTKTFSDNFEEFMKAREANRGNNPGYAGKASTEEIPQRLGWDKHSDNVYNLKNEFGEETGSAVFREHNDKWIGSRFDPKTNQIIDRKEFNTADEAMNYAEYKTHRDFTDRFKFDRKSLPKAETEVEGVNVGTFTPTKQRNAANNNMNLQIDDPVMDAAIDKTWENFGRANKDNLPLISPATEKVLQEANPTAFKKLKQFETEMDYKYNQPSGRRHWLSDLTEEEANRYRKLYNDIDKIKPVK